jgi:hypothetical protein
VLANCGDSDSTLLTVYAATLAFFDAEADQPVPQDKAGVDRPRGLRCWYSLLGGEYVGFRSNQIGKLLETIETRVEIGLKPGQVAFPINCAWKRL